MSATLQVLSAHMRATGDGDDSQQCGVANGVWQRLFWILPQDT